MNLDSVAEIENVEMKDIVNYEVSKISGSRDDPDNAELETIIYSLFACA